MNPAFRLRVAALAALSGLGPLAAPAAFSAGSGVRFAPSGDVRLHGESTWRDGTRAWAFALPGGWWALSNAGRFAQIHLSAARRASPKLGAGVTVAIIDTGIDANHPSLRGALRKDAAYDFLGEDGDPSDEDGGTFSGHGTAVAGIIHQIAPNARLLPLRVLGADGSGQSDNVARAIRYATDHGANVINLSLGSRERKSAVSIAIQSAVNRGVLVVCSVGNRGEAHADYPAADAPREALLISVGSVDAQGVKSTFSNYGDTEVNANGEHVATLFPNGTTNATGTSFAAPQVSALAALALAEGRGPNAVARALVQGAADLDGLALNAPYSGKLGGLLNARQLFATVNAAR